MAPPSISRMQRQGLAVLGLIVGLLTVSKESLRAAGASENETLVKVKAGFIFNFAKFTIWPPEQLAEEAPLQVGVVGSLEVVRLITSGLHGKMFAGHPIEVIAVDLRQPLPVLQILYLSSSTEKDASLLATAIGSAHILTIADTPDFAHRWGVIAFFERDGKIRFRINPSNARRAGLKLNSQLATLAEIVGT